VKPVFESSSSSEVAAAWWAGVGVGADINIVVLLPRSMFHVVHGAWLFFFGFEVIGVAMKMAR